MPKEYLLVFAYVPELAVYRISELQACAQIFNTTVTVVSEDSGAMGCFVRAEFENDAVAAQIASRMILLKGVFEVWGEAVDYPELIKNIQSFDPTVRSQYKSASFKFVFEAFGAKVTFSEKVERFNKFSDVGLDGPVEMTKPEQVFWVLEDRGIPTTNKKSHNEMVKVLFARQVGVGARRMLDTHSLKTRAYIGTTTMVPELCMLMANIALVQKGSFVWDPFCGTGSVLVSASHFGAVSFGSDLDGRALGCKERGIQSNYKQYGFTPVEIMRLDMSQSSWRAGKAEIFEAIISDPPYGRRESRKRIDEERQDKLDTFVSALNDEQKKDRLDKLAQNYIPPPKREYVMNDLLTDLVDKAAKLLTVGGRLVYWHPTTAKYTSAELASHPCMTLLSDKGQSISIKLKRRLVVMEKTCAWDAAMQVVPPTAMDVCEDFHYANDVGDCDEYVEYKQKRDQKKAACKRYREENAIDTPAKLTRGERRKLQQEQIERKRQRRMENHEASRETSLFLTKIDRVRRGRATAKEMFGDNIPPELLEDATKTD